MNMTPSRVVTLCKVEVTYNTDAAPVPATDAFNAENVQIAPANTRMHQRASAKPTLGQEVRTFGGQLYTISFDVDVKGSGTAGTAPEFGPALRACALGETIVASTSVTYAPSSTSTDKKSATIWIYRDGLLWKFTGCRGTVSLRAPTGMPAKLSFTMTGHLASKTDAALVTPTLQSTVSQAVFNLSSWAIDSYAAPISTLSMDLGNNIETPDDITAADGFGEIGINGRNVTGEVDPLEVAVATYDWLTKLQGGNTGALDTGVIGGTAGNRWQLQMPVVGYLEVTPGERSGYVSNAVPYYAAESSGDDEFSLAFT